ncbi:hypothetical protein PVAP13_3KG041800 [Panicum virgatum]|uniref:Uncharacterized protein n=1 Tax=Panicum virgatum TaxID=38727 RepID=A0A8T0UK32_PANVG|nr:hypothetical protein PVAP13_3KG041800 [Panicum virgatum]
MVAPTALKGRRDILPPSLKYLLDSLLHEIIVLINSFHDFLAFIGTCRSWRTAVSSFPSVYTFSFPPLHFEPDGPYFRPHSIGIKPLLLSNCKWKLSDSSKENLSLRCALPQSTPNTVYYLGCSYGYLIFTYEDCLLVDAYTGAKVKAPKLPCNNELGWSSGIGVLTAPFSSPNSRLLLFSRASMFEWQVGTNSRLFEDPDETWTAVELGESVPKHNIIHSMVYGFSLPPDYSQIGSLWLFPSLVYGRSQ